MVPPLSCAHGEGGGTGASGGAGGVSAPEHVAVMTDPSGAKTRVKQQLSRKGKEKGEGRRKM